MIVEILLLIQVALMFILIRAVRGPEILYHRRKRATLFVERIKEHVANFIRCVRAFIR